ncbi:hypothetical protein CDD83_4001 [Cordyceps sp. RAO-2017]|nr:hypothetical protein CDD83_4001 [Cordyceps sp. RAO-2017]
MALLRGAALRHRSAPIAGLVPRAALPRLGARCYAESSEAAKPVAPAESSPELADASQSPAPAPVPPNPLKKPRSTPPGKHFKKRSRPGMIPADSEEFGRLHSAMDKARSRASREPWNNFSTRHIGPHDDDINAMLKLMGPGAESLDAFTAQVIPADVMSPPPANQMSHYTEDEMSHRFRRMLRGNGLKGLPMRGGGYYAVDTPPVIKRNILENPGWYTSYTPYQAEISQGRLESLLNFQTMVADLTGLPVANASLLDEGTAATEAMTMSLNHLPPAREKRPDKTYVVSHLAHRTTPLVMQSRAEGLGIRLQTMDLSAPEALQKIRDLGDDLVGVLVQYPDTHGGVQDFRELADVVHQQGALLTAATDLSALTVLTPPGEWGADIALGNSQRFGVPLGFGGPHAAFMAVRDSIKRRLPGRLVGVSKDRTGGRALRLALQTREQHIRREKATSNVCTAQALLANMAAMYAVYHGPAQLRGMAASYVRYARMLQATAQHYGHQVVTRTLDPEGRVLSDTVVLRFANKFVCRKMYHEMWGNGLAAGCHEEYLTLAVGPSFDSSRFLGIAVAFKAFATRNQTDDHKAVALKYWSEGFEQSADDIVNGLPDAVRRQSSYLTHPVFNSHHSETELLRYMHHLQSKDLSLVHSMIPLGSCTMKLNGASQMELLNLPQIAHLHPHTPIENASGYQAFMSRLSAQLSALTGMDVCSLQPNSGAQGEFAGLRVIRKYHETQPGEKRDICLIPVSAHGTNPASANMAGMKVVPLKCDTQTGNLDLGDLELKCQEYRSRLGAIMITYPSTFGVFEPNIRKVCDIVHEHGGLVYMDGANMNAQIGLTSPGALGADVCHLNLHKTFCIPHGGGGPGVGPICAKEFLGPWLPDRPGQAPVTSAPYGSASILSISWAYLNTMGDAALRKATQVALLNANYLLTRLKDHYPILYTNDQGRCAHEFIVDARPTTASTRRR